MRDTINNAVINFLEDSGCGTFGIDLFFGRVPEKNLEGKNTPADCWWIVPLKTSTQHHNATGEDTIRYPYALYFRSRQLKNVDQQLQYMTNIILDSHCYNIGDYKTINIELIQTNDAFGQDTEERAYASLSFAATLYDVTNPLEAED